MSAAYRTGTAANVLRAAITALAVLLFLTQVLRILTDTDGWDATPDTLKVTLVLNCVSYLVLAVIGGVALASRRFGPDLLLLAAGGWAIAWTYSTGPSTIPYAIEFSKDDYAGVVDWAVWTSAALGLLLAVVSAGFLATILSGASGRSGAVAASGTSGGSSGTVGGSSGTSGGSTGPAIPAGWHTDPSGAPRQERWWDGSAWTDHVRDAR